MTFWRRVRVHEHIAPFTSNGSLRKHVNACRGRKVLRTRLHRRELRRKVRRVTTSDRNATYVAAFVRKIRRIPWVSRSLVFRQLASYSVLCRCFCCNMDHKATHGMFSLLATNDRVVLTSSAITPIVCPLPSIIAIKLIIIVLGCISTTVCCMSSSSV